MVASSSTAYLTRCLDCFVESFILYIMQLLGYKFVQKIVKSIFCFANYIHQTVADCQWNQSYQLSTFLILYFNVESIYLMKVVMFSQLAPSPKHPFRQPLFKKNFSKGNFKLTSTETITQTWNYYVCVMILINYKDLVLTDFHYASKINS